MSTARLTAPEVNALLARIGIHRLDPVDRSPASGEDRDDAGLEELLKKGDPLAPTLGGLPEDPEALQQLRATFGATACFPLTPDGHLASHQPIVFSSARAVVQAIVLLEANLAAEDREEALTATWLGLAYHNSDHPADFGGLVWDQSDDRPLCCYVDVKRTQSATARRAKLEQRAQERKFGMMALTVTQVAREGFRRYPGRGKPGLIVTLLHTTREIQPRESVYAMNWFLGIASNYPASAARWGFGGPNGVRLPAPLEAELQARVVEIRGVRRSWRDLLAAFRDYNQYCFADGTWDRETFQATLEAMALTARYLLMNDNVLEQVETTLQNLQPVGVDTPLSLEDFHPGESLVTYFGRKADENARRADENARRAEDNARKAEDNARKAEDNARRAEDNARIADKTQRALEESQREVSQMGSTLQQKDTRIQQIGGQLQEKDCQLQHQEAILRLKERQLQERESELTQRESKLLQIVAKRRLRGHSDSEIAEDLGYTIEEFRQLFPTPAT